MSQTRTSPLKFFAFIQIKKEIKQSRIKVTSKVVLNSFFQYFAPYHICFLVTFTFLFCRLLSL